MSHISFWERCERFQCGGGIKVTLSQGKSLVIKLTGQKCCLEYFLVETFSDLFGVAADLPEEVADGRPTIKLSATKEQIETYLSRKIREIHLINLSLQREKARLTRFINRL